MSDEFRKVKTSELYESIDAVGGQKSAESINQPSTSGVKKSPVKSTSFAGVLVNNKQVCYNHLFNCLKLYIINNLCLFIER